MKYEIGFVDNPRFESITGLTNTTFDPNNIQEDRMASEAQVLAAWNASADLEMEVERCCKDMCVWETYVQIVRMNTNTLSSNGVPNSGGVVISPFSRNRRSGIIRQGEIYTATFSLPFNGDIYAPYTIVAANDGGIYTTNFSNDIKNIKAVQYRLVVDGSIVCASASASVNQNSRRHNFFKFVDYSSNNFNNNGYIINNVGNWGSFARSVADDGTVSITDSRQMEGGTVFRYYTQWTLRECANGSLLPNPT